MVEEKTVEEIGKLIGAELDFLVGQHDPRCKGLTWERREDHYAGVCDAGVACFITNAGFIESAKLRRQYVLAEEYAPSRNWMHGGPIIERELIELTHDRDWREDGEFGRVWQANDGLSGYYDGDTPLIAAMRAFVASQQRQTQLGEPK